MTGGHLVPLLAVLGTVVLLNLAITWLLVRWDRDPAELLGSARYAPEDATADSEPAEDGGTDARDSEAARSSEGTEPTTLRTSAGTELRLSGPGSDGESDPPPLDVAGEAVICRHCGAENRPGYRYCRWCVRSEFVDEESGVAAGATMTERSL
ncbi:DUF7577 domain-containing protein [Halorubrum sp. DTA46]|uniref:DUF7577 domain-containing protein n=1 Tax=Halorubrum sp. DTA46 TaxID=3402162 RepID=UPI003AADEB47